MDDPNATLSAGEDAVAEAELGLAPGDIAMPERPTWRTRLSTAATLSAGGILGANARYLVGRWATDRWGSAFPWATFLINLTGSFVLGFYLTLATERFRSRSSSRLFVATGFLGAYTTFSTFSYETVRLVQDGHIAAAVGYVGASLIAGVIAVLAGIVAARAL